MDAGSGDTIRSCNGMVGSVVLATAVDASGSYVMFSWTVVGSVLLVTAVADDGSYVMDVCITSGSIVDAIAVAGSGIILGVTGYRKRAIETRILWSVLTDTLGLVVDATADAVAVMETDPSMMSGFMLDATVVAGETCSGTLGFWEDAIVLDALGS